jgi:thiol-disulfide isomerase/thioredoxin
MKTYITSLIAILFLVACGTTKKASQFAVTQDGGEKILRGTITRALIEQDTAFGWFKENMKWGKADAAAVSAFSKNKDKFTMVVFGGTWCHDTQNLLPIFYRLVDKSGYPDKNITLIGVDRAKTAPNDLHLKYNIKNVPTFIVFKDGKEVGRVVEYGTKGAIDKELGEIVAAL